MCICKQELHDCYGLCHMGETERPYWDYSDEEKKHLWRYHGLQPCTYCGYLTDNMVCGTCDKGDPPMEPLYNL
jgi:hypothetical protein